MTKKIKLICLIFVFMFSAVLSACGSGEQAAGNKNTKDSESKIKLGQKELTIPYVNWASATASNYVIQEVLESVGYKVNLKSVKSGIMYASIAKGDADASICIWLPHTDKEYWQRFGDKIHKLGPNIKGAPLGLAVPKYMNIDSLKDLANNTNNVGEKLDWTITGIDSGAGEMQLVKNTVMPEYELDKWTLQSSSSTAMTAALQSKIKNHNPIVVTLWSPHWAFKNGISNTSKTLKMPLETLIILILLSDKDLKKMHQQLIKSSNNLNGKRKILIRL